MKLSLDALKERAEATASNDLLTEISGGLDNACHDAPTVWTVDFSSCGQSNPTGQQMSMSAFLDAVGQFFIRTGL
ncbi:MAG: hypothetical protein M0D53_05925 [Flavobacterium sp. JAD_PAG50586_2]|nr:MAG: hypothetical protein M0D53_05925 [Flavobacterium sp. JAD_PAG50586_2]